MVEQLSKTLDERLKKVKKKPTSLIGRVVSINHLLPCSLWFILALKIGDPTTLKISEKIIITFLWAGQQDSARHKVNYDTITQSKRHGELSLISLAD